MKVGHTDSTGKRWVFDVPVNKPIQAGIFARFLRTVSNVGKKETSGSFHTTEYISDVVHLSREVEATVLEALRQRYPSTDEGNDIFLL